ncbi:aminotransferase class V-fold PLP-dependent enzyme [Pelagibacteraceae bacterium]|nr:aminotransferase class V-fold PLP-dependent enzyme [Pelagibacteraceae bacterium]
MINNIKKRFPVFEENPNLVFFDTAASALKVDSMINAITECYSYEYANIHRGIYDLSSKLTKRYEDSRLAVSKFIDSPSSNNIIFTKSATEGINLVSSCLSSNYFEDGDEVLVTSLEHHANLVPWHLVSKKIKIVAANIMPSGELDYKDLFEKITSKTKLLSITHMSNVTGCITEFEEIKAKVKKFNIPILIDGCQYVPHKKLKIRELDPDFYVFSAHKLYGPSGLGILYMKDKWIDKLGPYQGGGSMIKNVETNSSTYLDGFQKFEAGTPPIAEVIGLSASLDFINEVGLDKIYEYENYLTKYAQEQIKRNNDIIIYGDSKNQTSIISFNLDGVHFNDLAMLLDRKNIAIRTGHHCAQPFMKYFKISGNARMSIGVYNTKDDVDYFIKSIDEVKKILKS